MPNRVQRKRRAGEAGIPAGAVYVGRPTVFGNPFKVGADYKSVYVHDDINVHYRIPGGPDASALVQERAVALYRAWLDTGDIRGLTELPCAELPPILTRKRGQIIGELHTLAGRDLCCWCPPERACHASVLLELANNPAAPQRPLISTERTP
ncbi:DUF4326 domain-containing protein [Mycolicibacterium fluoranthenivorans]|uniref:DUF4326 domain-containing protein n=1 Tax=Mycolicibacterium fluoranthenivorans TaxID=258505 RepID=UPI0014243780|nr:DUF4326 domain-containing protein [Mycolicibacterium fluoranthenivorans]MCV7359179.1 DUF4326 domain-containing protein [Mycolicibacterium fluoranthenivorans]